MRAIFLTLAMGALTASAALAQPRPLSAVPPLSQTPPSPPSTTPADQATSVSPLVVEAPSAQATKAFDAAVDKFVHEEGQPSPVHQLSRWTRPVCPEVFGFRKDMDAFVAQRIKAVAAKVGANGRGACNGTNVLVVFTSQPDALMADVRDHHALLLGPHLAREAKEIAVFHPPVETWYVTRTAASLYETNKKDAPEIAVLDNPYGQEQPHCTSIRDCTLDMQRNMRSEFAFALVVVDAKAVVGQPIGAIADEMAMAVLSKQASRTGCSALPSVMDLLDTACRTDRSPKKMSAYDEAYLKALYAPHDTEILYYDRARIEQAVRAVGLSPADAPDKPAAAETKPGDTLPAVAAPPPG